MGFFLLVHLAYRKLTCLADIIAAILPEDMLDEVPQGFTQVGHVGKSSGILSCLCCRSD